MAEPTLLGAEQVSVIGVLNATPDSFSDGGQFFRDGRIDLECALASARRMQADGADCIDIGGESTRPGAKEVAVEIEIARTLPIVENLLKEISIPISIDTRKRQVALAALEAGARVVNDVSGLHFDPSLAEVVAHFGATLILGHSRGTPETMQQNPHYKNVLDEVAAELAASLDIALRAGVALERIVLDPGIGFGKRLEDNLALLANLHRLKQRFGRPILVGPSRKFFLGELTGDPVTSREQATVAACAVAIFAGADAIRVHDVRAGRCAARVGSALRAAKQLDTDSCRAFVSAEGANAK